MSYYLIWPANKDITEMRDDYFNLTRENIQEVPNISDDGTMHYVGTSKAHIKAIAVLLDKYKFLIIASEIPVSFYGAEETPIEETGVEE